MKHQSIFSGVSERSLDSFIDQADRFHYDRPTIIKSKQVEPGTLLVVVQGSVVLSVPEQLGMIAEFPQGSIIGLLEASIGEGLVWDIRTKEFRTILYSISYSVGSLNRQVFHKIFGSYPLFDAWMENSKIVLSEAKIKLQASSLALNRVTDGPTNEIKISQKELDDRKMKENLIGNIKKISKNIRRNIEALNQDNDGLFEEFVQDSAGTLDLVNKLIEDGTITKKVNAKMRTIVSDSTRKHKIFSSHYVPDRLIFKYLSVFTNRLGKSKREKLEKELDDFLKEKDVQESETKRGIPGIKETPSVEYYPNIRRQSPRAYISNVLLNRPGFQKDMKSLESSSKKLKSLEDSSQKVFTMASLSIEPSTDYSKPNSYEKKLRKITTKVGFCPFVSRSDRSTSPKQIKKIVIK